VQKFILALYGLERLPPGLPYSRAQQLIEQFLLQMYSDRNYDDGTERIASHFINITTPVVDGKLKLRFKYVTSTITTGISNIAPYLKSIKEFTYEKALDEGIIEEPQYHALMNNKIVPAMAIANTPREVIPKLDKLIEDCLTGKNLLS
jgi:hypothetical protein